MNPKKTSDINFQIKGMELLESKLSEPKQPQSLNLFFQFDLKLEHRLNIEKQLLIVTCEVSILNESKNTLYGQLKGSCVYWIENMNEYLIGKEELSLPEEFITTLNSITISSIRGLMFSYFRGTFLHQAILPVIDPKKMESNKNK